MTVKYVKDPNAVLDYTIDWTAWLPGSDTITNATWTVQSTAAGAVVVEDVAVANHSSTVWLSGGVVGEKYTVTNHITTAGGRQDDRSIVISIKEL